MYRIFLTQDKEDWRKDTERIEADSLAMAEFIAAQKGLEVIGELVYEEDFGMN